MRKGQIRALLPVLVVPLFLLITAAVFNAFAANTQFSYETTYYNETQTPNAVTNISVVAHPPIESVTACYNGTDGNLLTASTHYNVTEAPNTETGEITWHPDSNDTVNRTGGPNCTYVGHGGGGWDTYDLVRTGTWSGYKLASQLPFIIIALTVIGVMVAAFLGVI